MNCQPLILKRILQAPEFETDIRDKVIRYYHLYRVKSTNTSIPVSATKWRYGWKMVSFPVELMKSAFYKHGIRNFHHEFSSGRSVEHFVALCKASAAVNERTEVEIADMWLVGRITRCFYLETEIFNKLGLGRRTGIGC